MTVLADPQQRRTGHRACWTGLARRRAGVRRFMGLRATSDDPERLAERLPRGLVAAVPDVPLVTLFVAVCLVRVGWREGVLCARLGLCPEQAGTVVGYTARGN